jgi:glycerol-3-phosphate cytidylyltransferase
MTLPHPSSMAAPTGPAGHVLLGAAPSVVSRPAGPRVALTYGTYDLFHIGHVRLFERIKQQFDHLIVAVSTDEFNAIKGKKSVVPYADRAAMVRACRWVDEVIAENDWTQKQSDVLAHAAHAVVMGSDWEGRFDHLKPLCDVLYLPRTEGVSSTDLKADVVAAVRARA